MRVSEDVVYAVGQPVETVVISKPTAARAVSVSAKHEIVSRTMVRVCCRLHPLLLKFTRAHKHTHTNAPRVHEYMHMLIVCF